MKKGMIKTNEIWDLLIPHKAKILVLIIVTLIFFFIEALSLLLIVPFISIMVTGTIQGPAIRFLDPIIGYLPGISPIVLVSSLFLLATVTKNLFQMLQIYLRSRFSWKLEESWKNRLFDKYMNMDYLFFADQKFAKIAHNITGETLTAAKSIGLIVQFLERIIINIFLLGVSFAVNWKFMVLAIIIGFVVFMPFKNITKLLTMRTGQEKIRLSYKIETLALESISGLTVVKAFGLETLRKKAYKALSRRLRVLKTRMTFFKSMPQPVGEIIVVLIFWVMIIAFSSLSVSKFTSYLPQIGLFFIVFQKFFKNLSVIITYRMNIYYSLPSLDLVSGLLAEEIPEEDVNIGDKMDSPGVAIIFDNVDFWYKQGVSVLNKCDLIIKDKKSTALIGPSGGGKTTIVALILGYIKPRKGRILVNGRDLSEYSLSSWRKRIGYVSQDIIVFNASIEENILMGKLDADKQDVVDAAKNAGLHDYIMGLPDQYDTNVGEKGIQISGGQKQRLSIARAMLRDPDLYIFDEATNALDSKTEEVIRESIRIVSKDKTIIIVAHRKSSIEEADEVYNLAKQQKEI
jgi:ABC-type multidrug transport system fused ATPase/permease subunit